MTLQTARLMKEAPSVETSANPPPRTPAGALEGDLFQTIDALRLRHADPPNTWRRILQLAMALLAGVAVFAALYGVMLFVE